MKHYFRLIFFLIVGMLGSCAKKEVPITNLKMLEGGKTFAVPTGTIADQKVLQKFPDARIKYYNTVFDCALAVKDGKADATSYDLPVLKNIAAKNDGIEVLSELMFDDYYGFAVQLENKELKAAIDSVLARIKADGTYADMMQRWFPASGSPAPMPALNFTGGKGILKFGTAAVTEPMSFYDANRNLAGFDIEFASRIALYLDRKLEVVDMEFGAMLPALISGKVDMIGAGLSITEERAKSVLFSESYYPSGIAVLVKSPSKPASAPAKPEIGSVKDIEDKRIGVLLGSVHDKFAQRNYPEATIDQYQSVSDMIMALITGKIDAALISDLTFNELTDKHDKIRILRDSIFAFPLGVGFNKGNTVLRDQFNTFLAEIKANDVYDDMVDRWVTRRITEMPVIENPGKNGSLTVGVSSNLGMPFAAVVNGENVGFDVELGKRFAAWCGKEYLPVEMIFQSILASLKTNKIDVATCGMMITEERAKEIDFSNPYLLSVASIIVKKEHVAGTGKIRFGHTEDVKNKKIGVLMGSIHDRYATRDFPDAQIFQYQNVTDMLMAVKAGKVDVAFADHVGLKDIFDKNPELGLFAGNLYTVPIAAPFNEEQDSLREQFNTFLREIKANGVYDDMVDRWMNKWESVLPEIETNGSNGTLRTGIVSDLGLPFSILHEGQPSGFDIELSKRFAAYLGKKYETVDMPFGSIIASLATNKIDLATCSMMITEEREKQVDFSDPYYESGVSLFALKENVSSPETAGVAGAGSREGEPVKKSFLKSVSESFHNNIILEKRYLLILDGLKLTILISIFSAILGTIIGGLICFMRMSPRKLLSGSAGLYISLLRGTPVLVLLMIIYYVVFASVNINPAIVAVIAFGLNFGAYVSEMFRTGIQSVDKGQSEAGIAGGFTKIQTFIHIIMPQALRHVLPVYKGEFISLVKMTSIVGYIAVQDLTKASDIIRSRTFDAFFPLIMAAVIYLFLAWLLTWALGTIEISVDPKRKRLAQIREEKK